MVLLTLLKKLVRSEQKKKNESLEEMIKTFVLTFTGQSKHTFRSILNQHFAHPSR